MSDIITAVGLVKRFGDNIAVDGVSFEIRDGEIFGLLGPNGAGKTTTISMISCLLAPTGGDIVVDGASVRTDPTRRRPARADLPRGRGPF
jgi:ABC-2 type transport system ATP-binding protein